MTIKQAVILVMNRDGLTVYGLHKLLCLRYQDRAPSYESLRRYINTESYMTDLYVDMIFEILGITPKIRRHLK
jgi:hypothetical protein